MTPNIRRAVTADIPWILSQLKEFSKFYGTKRELYSDDEWGTFFIGHLIDQHLFLVAESDQLGLLGLIAGTIEPHPYNPEMICLNECFWWVDEKHRGSKAGLLLLNDFIRRGKESCDWIWMTLEHHSPVKDLTLIRRGFKEQERSFLLEV